MPNHEFEDVDLDEEVVIVNGARFTEADADAVADELERSGRERSKANLVPGGKSLSGAAGKVSPVVNVRVAEATRDGLRAVAGGPAITKVARKALDEAQQYFVVWLQSFDGGQPDWVRFDKAMTLPDAQVMFENFKASARSFGWRQMQIRRGREQVIQEWPEAAQ